MRGWFQETILIEILAGRPGWQDFDGLSLKNDRFWELASTLMTSRCAISTLIRHFLGEGDEEKFKEDLKRKDGTKALADINGAVMALLRDLTGGVRQQTAALGFSVSGKRWPH